ncbi:MAG: hypothetical protein GEV10_21320 [Streptosporangiales bacterium]|nr:hypothetical protein [Streptosporangiales bacterium]
MMASVTERPVARRAPVVWQSHRRGTVVGLAVVGALTLAGCLVPSIGLSNYAMTIVYTVAFFTAVGQSWNIISGFTGYVSFAHGALIGLGSYAGIIASNAGAGFGGAILAGMAAALVASMVIGLPSLRLHGIAFAFATIFFQAAALLLAQKMAWITGGPQGLASKVLQPMSSLVVAMVLVAGVATVLVVLLRHARPGLQLLSIREDEVAASVSGVPTVRLKLTAFAVSSLFAGAAGAVHGFFLATVFPPSVFSVQSSVEPLVISLVGGMGTAFGAPAMAVVYAVSQELLTNLGSELQLALLGLVLVVVVLAAPEGLAGLVRRLVTRVRRRRPQGEGAGS